MEPIVVDSDVIVASFLESETHHNDARQYVDGLENGDYVFHLPMLVVVEVTSAISRRTRDNRIAFLDIWRRNVVDWELNGKLMLYSLDRNRMHNAGAVAERYGLRGSDSVIAALAEELGFSLRTFDREILEHYQQASR